METLYYTFKALSEITSVSIQGLHKRFKKESWPSRKATGIGGMRKEFNLSDLPSDIQSAIITYQNTDGRSNQGQLAAILPALSPAAAETALAIIAPPEPDQAHFQTLADVHTGTGGSGSTFLPAVRYEHEKLPTWSPERAISLDTLTNKRVGRILGILREAEDIPRDWKKGTDAWIKFVAAKHGVARTSIYRWKEKYDKRGIAGVEHRKSVRDKPKAWTPEALDWWISLCLKPEHRKINLKSLYEDVLIIEAHRRNWRVGCKESAVWWFNKRATPTMLALQKGGMRALDNILPPILRDYSDLAPFELLVGDQHRFDFWVVDDDTGQVFRAECFMWQDLRTRLIYGMAFDHHYDAHLCGLALRIGMRVWGCFNAIYTDNGKPELSKYMMGIMSQIRDLGMEWRQTDDAPLDILDVDVEEINPMIAAGTHKKAIVKNAKAKMIEGTFCIFEDILRSRFRVSGSVKRLGDDIHAQDIDHEEAMKLAANGKLMLASEFYLTCYRAIDYYNREKTHRGVRKEWAWKPKPAAATPMDCLKACYESGWRPKAISDNVADLIFLKRASRIVNLGRISLENETYEHDMLIDLHKQRVDIRFNPIESDTVLVFHDRQYLCTASPVEYSSMKNDDLAGRKIEEKRHRRKQIAEKFRALTSKIPDFREYSSIPETEKVAALVGQEKKRIEAARANMERDLSPEELAREIEKLEAMNARMPDGKAAGFAIAATGSGSPRPDYFISNTDRYLWCVKCEASGGELSAEDREFVALEEASMTPDQRERWQFEREYGT